MCLKNMPSSVLIWMDRLFNFFAWLAVQTIFDRVSSSKIGSKSHRPIFAWLVQGEIPMSCVSSVFLWSEMICMVFFCKFAHIFALLFCPSYCELWFTINWISEKSIVNTCKMLPWESTLLQHLFHAFQAIWYSFCSSVLPFSSTTIGSFLLIKLCGIVSASSLSLWNFLLDSLSTKNCPQVQFSISWFT